MLNKPLDLTNRRDKRVLLFEFWYTNNQSSSQKSRNRSMIVKWTIWWKNYIKIIEYYVKLWKSNFFSFFEQRRLELKNSDNSEKKKKKKKFVIFLVILFVKLSRKEEDIIVSVFVISWNYYPSWLHESAGNAWINVRCYRWLSSTLFWLIGSNNLCSNIADLYKCVGHKLGSPSW